MASATPASDAFEGIKRGDLLPLVNFVIHVFGEEKTMRMFGEMKQLPPEQRMPFMSAWLRKQKEASDDERLADLVARM